MDYEAAARRQIANIAPEEYFDVPGRGPVPSADAKRFLLAGKSTVTFLSPTGVRFTFTVTMRKMKDETILHFVALVVGSKRQFLGTIFSGNTFRHGSRSPVDKGSASAKAFAWTFARIMADEDLKGVEIWHEAKCGKCGQGLSVPESIARGFGPSCFKNA